MNATDMIKIDSVEYWDRQPCNARYLVGADSLQRSRNATRRKKLNEPHIWRWSNFETWRGRNVLILGCGIGTQALEFARNGAYVTAIDFSEQSIQIATVRAAVEEIHNVSFICGDIELGATYEDLATDFDLLYSFGVLHHTPAPIVALCRAKQHLRPGALCYIMLYYRWAWKWLKVYFEHGEEFDYDLVRTVREYSEAQTGCPWTTIWSRGDARALLEVAGFSVYEMMVDHIFRWNGDEYGRGRYVVDRPWRKMPEWVFHIFERTFGQHLLLKGVAE